MPGRPQQAQEEGAFGESQGQALTVRPGQDSPPFGQAPRRRVRLGGWRDTVAQTQQRTPQAGQFAYVDFQWASHIGAGLQGQDARFDRAVWGKHDQDRPRRGIARRDDQLAQGRGGRVQQDDLRGPGPGQLAQVTGRAGAHRPAHRGQCPQQLRSARRDAALDHNGFYRLHGLPEKKLQT